MSDIELPEPRARFWEGLAPALLGVILIIQATQWHPVIAALALPGALLSIASGVGLLLWSGDPRLPQFAALGAVAAVLPLPFAALAGFGLAALALLALCVLAYLMAGRASLLQFPACAGTPPTPEGLAPAARLAVDESLLALFKLAIDVPQGDDAERIVSEIGDWERVLAERGGAEAYGGFFPKPPDLLKVESRERQSGGRRFREIRFDSEFEPPEGLPGRERWLSYDGNRRAQAWILEHPGPARPWLLTIHGYRMGLPWLDLRVFDPAFFHRRLGLNVASIVLPFHGDRRDGRWSGDRYLEGDVMDFVYAEMQAQWDIRRLLSWLRLVRHAPSVGAYGISLGGYNASLLAGLDDDLACVIAGIPVFDMADVLWRHMPMAERDHLGRLGLDHERFRKAFAPVAPGSHAPKLATDRLGIFAGTVDSLVWPDQPLRLQQHWNGARLGWYDGAHLTFLGERAVTEVIKQTLQAGGLLGPDMRAVTSS